MASITVPQPYSARHRRDAATQSVYFQRLVARIAGKDRIAFAHLYDALSPRLYGDIRSVLAAPVRTIGVLAATFVEVWALARFHAGAGDHAEAWITDIAVRRTMDRQFAGDSDPHDEAAADHVAFPRSQLRWTALADSHDRQYLLSLAALLNRPHVAFPDDPGSRPVGEDAASTPDLAVEPPQWSERTISAAHGCSAADDQAPLVHLTPVMPPQCSSRRRPRAPEIW